ncbi:Hypothetical predicted protein [Olea europaea subsp. europaea]|uniref:Uncharacterized protein n=1 Tax=Olea europaea subsp. europaea TaxID=158383 RepID=A0A8S0UWD9_OLEEU|nr:Hypothetical predicted protein [Olea europaea subsp. europaea]
MASRDEFNKKRPLRPNFKTIQKMIAELRVLKTSSSTYKKKTVDLVAVNKRLQPTAEEEDPKAVLLRKGKRATDSLRGPTVARPASVRWQTTIPTGVAIRERVTPPPEAPATTTAPVDTPLPATPLAQVSRQQRKKRARPKKEMDFLGISSGEPVGEVLEALLPEMTVVAMVHNRYCTEEWRDHTASCTTKDLVAANNACIA